MPAASSPLSLSPGLFLNLAAEVLHPESRQGAELPLSGQALHGHSKQLLGCSQNMLSALLATYW